MTGSAGHFKTSAAEMARVADRARTVNSGIQADLRRLEGVVSSLTHGWRGDAATAYQQLQHRWNEDAALLNRALAGIAERLDVSGRNYSTTDDQQRSHLTGIRAALG